jgi:LAO/AO transport system kinase
MEIADVFVINKADRPGADLLEREIHAALSMSPGVEQPPIVKVVATEGQGIAETLAAVWAERKKIDTAERRQRLWSARLKEMLRERVLEKFPAAEIEAAALRVAARERDPYSVIDDWLQRV